MLLLRIYRLKRLNKQFDLHWAGVEVSVLTGWKQRKNPGSEMLQSGYCVGRRDALARRLGPLREAHCVSSGSKKEQTCAASTECAGQTGS